MEAISGKWKACLINNINKGIKRPSELHIAHPEYSLTELGKTLLPLIALMLSWGNEYTLVLWIFPIEGKKTLRLEIT